MKGNNMSEFDGALDRSEIKSLKEKRANLWSESQADLAKLARSEAGAEGTAELDAKVDRQMADVELLTKTIERAEQMLEADARDQGVLEEREERTGVKAEEYDAVFRSFIREGAREMNAEQRKVLGEHRAQSVGTNSAGGYTVPEGFWNRVSETKLAFGNVASVANVITTATGNDLPWMTNDDTTNEGAILAENTQIGEQDVTFGTRSLGAYLYTSKLIRVSYQLLQDSAIDVEGFLARKMAMRLARIHNRHQTLGTGTAQPEGIVTGATTGVTTNGATAITLNELIDLVHSVDPAYRGGSEASPEINGGGRFMLSDDVLQYVRKIRDDSGGSGLGRPIWEPSIQVGIPSTLLGKPYVVNQHMASIASGNTTVLFGDFREGFVIRNVKDMSVVRLDERYADFLQVGWFAYDRMDAVTDNTDAYKALVQA